MQLDAVRKTSAGPSVLAPFSMLCARSTHLGVAALVQEPPGRGPTASGCTVAVAQTSVSDTEDFSRQGLSLQLSRSVADPVPPGTS